MGTITTKGDKKTKPVKKMSSPHARMISNLLSKKVSRNLAHRSTLFPTLVPLSAMSFKDFTKERILKNHGLNEIQPSRDEKRKAHFGVSVPKALVTFDQLEKECNSQRLLKGKLMATKRGKPSKLGTFTIGSIFETIHLHLFLFFSLSNLTNINSCHMMFMHPYNIA